MEITKKAILPFFIIFLLIISLTFVLAQTEEEAGEDESGKVALAYKWLSDQVKDDWPASTEDSAFALLALAYDDKLASEGRKALLAKKTDGGWSTIKQTALALLALGRLGEKTTTIENWLLNKSKTFEATGLEWYIQIEIEGNTSCEIRYDGKADEVIVYEDKKVKLNVGGTPKCLSDSPVYWLRISSDEECLKKTYSFYCDDYVKGSLLYKKDKTWFVPSKTEEKSQFSLKIESICLAEGGKCNYEGTLWAAYALSEQGRDIDLLLPYLVAQADAEEKYLPNAFLFILSDYTEPDYAESLLAIQDKKGYWYRMYKFYDTALVYLALKEYYGADESLELAKNYLLGHQMTAGSWDNSIRDTAFVLYAVWPKEVSPLPPELINECTTRGYHCRTSCIGYNEVEAEEYSGFCEEDEFCCKPEGVITECEDAGHKCCTKCDPGFNTFSEYNEGCWPKVCCEKCEEVEEEIPECEKKGYKCCTDCDPSSVAYPEYDKSCPGFARCCEKCEEGIEICNNDIDDDRDGYTDCDDPDCVTFKECQPKSKAWLFILIAVVVLVGLFFLLRKKGFRFSTLIGKFKKKRPPRFGEQPAEVLARPRPRILLGRHFRRLAPQPLTKAKETKKSETEEELEKTLQKLKKISGK